MNCNRLFHAVAALMLLSGCSADLTDKPLVVSDVDALEAAAEFAEGTDDNIRVLKIRSNRSWYAHLNNVNDPVPVTETVEWGQIDVCEHFNLTGAMDEVQVTVSFNRNYSQAPVNGVLNFYSEKQLFMSIPVRQEGAVYRLAPQADRTDATCGEDRININVDCNTAWTAEILAGGTAEATLMQAHCRSVLQRISILLRQRPSPCVSGRNHARIRILLSYSPRPCLTSGLMSQQGQHSKVRKQRAG